MPRPLIGINTDNFTDEVGRIEGIRPAYWQAIERAGGAPVLIPPSGDDPIASVLDRLDGVLLTGGDDLIPERVGLLSVPKNLNPMTAERDRADFALIEAIQRRRMPALGICLACQELNVARGGTLWLDIETDLPQCKVKHCSSQKGHSAIHRITVEPDTILSEIWGGARKGRVNSRHHQAIREVGSGLRVLAHAPDGLVEAIQVADHPFFIAVQWHPENLVGDPLAEKLFEALVKHALNWKENAPGGRVI